MIIWDRIRANVWTANIWEFCPPWQCLSSGRQQPLLSRGPSQLASISSACSSSDWWWWCRSSTFSRALSRWLPSNGSVCTRREKRSACYCRGSSTNWVDPCFPFFNTTYLYFSLEPFPGDFFLGDCQCERPTHWEAWSCLGSGGPIQIFGVRLYQHLSYLCTC